MYGCVATLQKSTVTYNKCGHILECIPNCALVRTSIECGVKSSTPAVYGAARIQFTNLFCNGNLYYRSYDTLEIRTQTRSPYTP